MLRSTLPGLLLALLCCQTVAKAFPTKAFLQSLNTTASGGVFWEDLQVVAADGTVLLEPFSGSVANGQLCGILGPSGAGKTTFLSAIGGRYPRYGVVSSYQSVSNQTIELHDIQTSQIAWLKQHDDFFSMLSVRETMELAAFLEWPSWYDSQRRSLVQGHLDALGLAHVASRKVGSFYGIGPQLSGGEKRRLSVALELITDKELFLADEPTSGLDSSMSGRVVDFIRQATVKRDIPCFCVLHQPRSSIWHALDTFVLVAQGGRVCYAGKKRDAVDYFAALGFPCPSATNPAEFFIDLVSVDMEDPVQALVDEKRIEDLRGAFVDYQKQEKSLLSTHSRLHVSSETNRGSSRRGILEIFPVIRLVRRFGALVRRSWRQNARMWGVNVFRFVASIGNACLLASIFPSVHGPVPEAGSVADRVALLSFGAINMCFLSFMRTVRMISEEKPVVEREQTRKQYSSLEYLAAKVATEFPFDAFFVSVFTTGLKHFSGLRIGWLALTSVFSLLTVAGSALGLFLGSWLPSGDLATTGSIPVLIIMMVVGISKLFGDPKPNTIPLLNGF